MRPALPDVPYPPLFQIPESTLASLFAADRAGVPTFWSHELYQNPARKGVKVTYCRTLQESEECAARFVDEPVLGFDMEWMFPAAPGIKHNISLIQVANEKEIGLFHIAAHDGSTAEELLAPTLRRIFESPYNTKVGVAVYSADAKRLQTYFSVDINGFFELSHLHKLVKYGASQPDLVNKKLVALKTLSREHLGLPLSKGPVRTSSWSDPVLSEEQRIYAAIDAYCGYQLFQVMNKKRLAMSPMPPLPAFAELRLPITLPSSYDAGATSKRALNNGYDPSTLDLTARKILEALVAWRAQVSEDLDMADAILIEDATLAAIASLEPRNMDELLCIDGPHRQDLSIGLQLLRVVRRCKEASASSANSISSVSSYESAETSFSDAELDSSIVASLELAELQDRHDEEANLRTHGESKSSQGTVTATQTQPTEVDRQLLSALNGLRIKLATKSQLDSIKIASDDVLHWLALHRPLQEEEFQKVEGAYTFSVLASLYGVSLISWIAKYRSQNSALDDLSGQFSQITVTD